MIRLRINRDEKDLFPIPLVLRSMICLHIIFQERDTRAYHGLHPRPASPRTRSAFRKARMAAGLSQEQTALRANISRPRYRDIETGAAAARATTLVNVARALGMEMMLIPQAMVPAIQSMLQPAVDDEDRPAFTSDPEEDERS